MSFIFFVRIFLGIFLFASSVVISTNIYALLRARRLEATGGRVEGVCISHYWPSGGYVGIVVEFSMPTGEKISVKSSRYQTAPVEVGSPVTVFFDEGKPGRSLIGFEAEKRIGYDTLIVLLMVVVAAVSAAFLLVSVY